nr:hypothetical protein [uncultured Rhodopila sp.]
MAARVARVYRPVPEPVPVMFEVPAVDEPPCVMPGFVAEPAGPAPVPPPAGPDPVPAVLFPA